MNLLTKSQKLENLNELITFRKQKVDRLTKEINALENKVLKLEFPTGSVTPVKESNDYQIRKLTMR